MQINEGIAYQPGSKGHEYIDIPFFVTDYGVGFEMY
jgi:hypothetical protein